MGSILYDAIIRVDRTAVTPDRPLKNHLQSRPTESNYRVRLPGATNQGPPPRVRLPLGFGIPRASCLPTECSPCRSNSSNRLSGTIA